MKKHAWMWGGIVTCLLWAPTLSAQTQRQVPQQVGGVRPASYCASCTAGGPAYAAPVYGGMMGGACEPCGVPACEPCGGCGSLVRELFCDVKTLVDVSVGSVLRCLLPCGPVCDTCVAPACEPMACSGCGVTMPSAGAPVPMMEPIPAPAIQGQPDPFRDDPVSTSRMMPRYRGNYSAPARMAAHGGTQPASYAAPVVAPQVDRYRPAHSTQLRRASTYPSPTGYR